VAISGRMPVVPVVPDKKSVARSIEEIGVNTGKIQVNTAFFYYLLSTSTLSGITGTTGTH